MELLELMKTRHSIRRYQDRQVPEPELRTILEAGLYAPNAGGGQRSMVVALRGRELSDRVGRWNAACMDRTHLAGSYVSAEQQASLMTRRSAADFTGRRPWWRSLGSRIFYTASRILSALRKIWS